MSTAVTSVTPVRARRRAPGTGRGWGPRDLLGAMAAPLALAGGAGVVGACLVLDQPWGVAAGLALAGAPAVQELRRRRARRRRQEARRARVLAAPLGPLDLGPASSTDLDVDGPVLIGPATDAAVVLDAAATDLALVVEPVTALDLDAALDPASPTPVTDDDTTTADVDLVAADGDRAPSDDAPALPPEPFAVDVAGVDAAVIGLVLADLAAADPAEAPVGPDVDLPDADLPAAVSVGPEPVLARGVRWRGEDDASIDPDDLQRIWDLGDGPDTGLLPVVPDAPIVHDGELVTAAPEGKQAVLVRGPAPVPAASGSGSAAPTTSRRGRRADAPTPARRTGRRSAGLIEDRPALPPGTGNGHA